MLAQHCFKVNQLNQLARELRSEELVYCGIDDYLVGAKPLAAQDEEMMAISNHEQKWPQLLPIGLGLSSCFVKVRLIGSLRFDDNQCLPDRLLA
jgi:hypothetical protein